MLPVTLLALHTACAPLGGTHSADLPVDTPADSAAAPDSAVDSGDEPAPATPLRVAVVSDLNGSYGSTTYRDEVTDAVAALLADPPDLVLSTGDMVAGQRDGLDYGAMWSAFHATVSDRLAAASIPFAVTPGNHDASAYSGYEAERDAFAAAWADRRPDVTFVDDEEYPFRYAFTVGDTLFVSLDDTLVGALSPEQSAWLDAVLDAPASVRIVYGHVPLYPFAEGRETEALFDDDLEQLLLDHDVTAFISGHHHAYYPGHRGPLRLVGTSCLGDSARNLIGTDGDSPRSVLRFTVTEGAMVDLDAYAGSGFDTPIERAALPATVGDGGDTITRDDL